MEGVVKIFTRILKIVLTNFATSDIIITSNNNESLFIWFQESFTENARKEFL